MHDVALLDRECVGLTAVFRAFLRHKKAFKKLDGGEKAFSQNVPHEHVQGDDRHAAVQHAIVGVQLPETNFRCVRLAVIACVDDKKDGVDGAHAEKNDG